jgi:hypothetical protein
MSKGKMKCATGVKKVAIKKYAEGGTVEDTSKPKKMNFVSKFINKQREKEQAFQDYSDAEDVQSFKDAGVNKPVAIEKMSVRTPSMESKESFTSKKLAPIADTTSVPKSDKPIGFNDEGEKERVVAYQKRHGLKADGVWGKDTEKYFQDSKKAAPKKMAIKKTVTPEVTKTEVVAEKPKSSTLATGYKGKDDNVYFSNGRTYNTKTGEKGTVGDGSIYSDKNKNVRAANADMKAWGDATSKKKTVVSKPKEESSSLFNSIPNLDYSKFPKTKKKK